MVNSKINLAQQIALTAIDFARRRTGYTATWASVMLRENTLVITLDGALSPLEQDLVKSPGGAAKVREIHSRYFRSFSGELRDEIKKIIGIGICDGGAEIITTRSVIGCTNTTDTMVQIFLLARKAIPETWSGDSSIVEECACAANSFERGVKR